MIQDVVRAHSAFFLGSRLKRLAEQMQADVVQVSQQVGLPMQPGLFPVLVALETSGPATVTALAKAMRFSQPAVTQSVAKLREAGLVEVARDPADARQHPVVLTSAGAEVLARARCEVWPLVEGAVHEALSELDGDLIGQIDALEAALARRPLSARAASLIERALVPITEAEVPDIAAFMNGAFRNIGTAKGWTSEEAYITGDRTKAADLHADMLAKPDGALLAWRRLPTDAIDGCVWVAPRDRDLWELGALAVAPSAQNAGLGRRLLADAEAWMVAHGACAAEITVVNVRDTLIAWYERRGYAPTGETRPWPYEDDRYGTPTRGDLSFIVMRKELAPGSEAGGITTGRNVQDMKRDATIATAAAARKPTLTA